MSTSSYITLEELSKFVKNDVDFKVIDAKTNDDITRVILTQIILDHELAGYNILPVDFLKLIIKFYDHKMNQMFKDYLISSLKYFNQDNIKHIFNNDFVSLTKNLTEFNMIFFNDLFNKKDE